MQYCKCNHLIANEKCIIQMIVRKYKKMNAVLRKGLLQKRQSRGVVFQVVRWDIMLDNGPVVVWWDPGGRVGMAGGRGKGACEIQWESVFP